MTVIVYGTPACPFCTMAKDYLKRKGVAFTYYDVSRDRERMQEMVAKSGQNGVPVIELNGRLIAGFDREQIDRALAMKKVDRATGIQNLVFDLFDQ